MIEDIRIERALAFIRDKAGEAGQLAGAVKEAEARRKSQQAIAFLQTQGTVAEREARAINDSQVTRAVHDYCEAIAEYETLKLQIKAAELTIEVWRTMNSNKRAGIM